ncbi:LamG-like jellyroll fold domain-containing protein [Rubritalea tangerina]|uniref:LamG-like jellyroll fold domain-containing protein n=1 Tax=Rubritalea tangerina TaxID=430798 RepID=UPI00361B91A8
MSSSHAAISLFAEYRLGEAGSLGANNLPLDSSGNNRDLTNQINGGSVGVGTTGVFAPGSTAYIDTSAATNQGWFGNALTGIADDNFAFGVFARASGQGANNGNVFSLGGGGGFKLSLVSNGWGASQHNVAWISDVNGNAGTFVADQWVHLALIRSAGVTEFYIDGVAQGANYAGVPTHENAHFSVDPGGATFFDGHIDEARVVTFTAGESAQDILNVLQGVPEPSSVSLLALGVTAFLARRRRNL